MLSPTTAEGLQSIVLREHSADQFALDSDLAARIHTDGHASVSPVGSSLYELRARGRVGVVRYCDTELRILPKVPIGRLLYLAAHGRLDKAWHDLDAELAGVDDPRSALAHVLIWHAEQALRPTPLQGYRSEESAERHLRGRVLFDRQIARRAGVIIPVELRFDEFDLDVIENQVLLAALLVVEPLVNDPTLSRQLAHLRFQLDGVTPWRMGVPVPEIPWTRLNGRYRKAVELARLLLDRRSVEFSDGRLAGRGFMIDMPGVFEAFLTSALGKELERSGGVVRAQHSTALDEDGQIKMYPDITWWRGGACLAVIDAKYKRVHNDNYPNADAYQMLAYCTRLGLPEGWLVYADLDGSEPSSQVIREAGVTLRIESIDLSGSIEVLNESVRRLSDQVRRSASATAE